MLSVASESMIQAQFDFAQRKKEIDTLPLWVKEQNEPIGGEV